MRGSGGTEGGVPLFLLGLALAIGATWFFFDSVRVETHGAGVISGFARRGGGMWETTSMGILFVPFFLGVVALFYDATMKWAWGLTIIGVLILAVEILSRIRFRMDMKTTHLLLIFVMLAAGTALMLRSYRGAAIQGHSQKPEKEEPPKDQSA